MMANRCLVGCLICLIYCRSSTVSLASSKFEKCCSPSATEIDRAVIIQPNLYWGKLFQDERDIRTLFIGKISRAKAICTILLNYFKGKDFMTSCSSMSPHFDDSKYPHDKFIFEDWGVFKWPNLLIFEVTFNCASEWNRTILFEKLFFRIRDKYEYKNITSPSVMLLELLPTQKFCTISKESRLDNRNGLKSFPLGQALPDYNPYIASSPYVLPMARFYGHVFISAIDAFWPALVRYGIQSNISTPFASWSLSSEERVDFTKSYLETLAEKVIGPLLLNQLNLSGSVSTHEGSSALHPIDNALTRKKSYYHIDYRLFANTTYRDGTDARWEAMEKRNERKLFSHIAKVRSSNWAYPTPVEASRGLVIRPPHFWGDQMEREHQIRVLAIGGSNTARGEYTTELQKYLKGNVSGSSYVINAGKGGSGPLSFFSEKYEFETWAEEMWPNLLIFEFGVNCKPGWQCLSDLDRVTYEIKEKYVRKNLTTPSVMILEALGGCFMYYNEPRTVDSEKLRTSLKYKYDLLNRPSTVNNERLSAVPEEVSAFNPFTDTGPYFAAFARFYGYALISAADSMWPAFIRHYMTKHYPHLIWPLSLDLLHFTQIGAEVFVQHILGPFLFTQVMRHDRRSNGGEGGLSVEGRDADDPVHQLQKSTKSLYLTDSYRMFAPSVYDSTVVDKWMSWGISVNSFIAIAQNTSQWMYQSTRGHLTGHVCYGSVAPGSSALIRFPVPAVCESVKEGCSLYVMYVHSWNRSYIGDCTFTLFNGTVRLDGLSSYPSCSTAPTASPCRVGAATPVNGSVYFGWSVRDTLPRPVLVAGRSVEEGPTVWWSPRRQTILSLALLRLGWRNHC